MFHKLTIGLFFGVKKLCAQVVFSRNADPLLVHGSYWSDSTDGRSDQIGNLWSAPVGVDFSHAHVGITNARKDLLARWFFFCFMVV